MQIQVWSWTETNWSLILLLVFGSGLLAWLGDVIGMKFGKRRVSLFGLRPKIAGHVITAITGIAIAILTVVILASFSDSVRTALFSLKYIQRQLAESRVNLINSQEEAAKATSELDTSREELERLRADTEILNLSLNTMKNDKQILVNERDQLQSSVELLKNEAEDMSKMLEQMKEGTIVVRVREVLGQEVIPPHSTPKDIEKIIEKARILAAENVAERYGTTPENIMVTIDKKSIENVIASASDSGMRKFIRVSATENTAVGASVQLECQAWNSYPIYAEGETIYRRLADPTLPDFNAEVFMHQFLRELRFKAIRDGVAPDPVSNNVGSLDGQKFFESVDKLKEMKLPVIVNGIATREIYTEGPVAIKILIEE